MLINKRLVFAILGAVLAGVVIAGIYYYETAYQFGQYSIDINSDLGKTAIKIALNTAKTEGYDPNDFIPHFIRARNSGKDPQFSVNDIIRLWVSLSKDEVYKNSSLITNHPIKDGENSILLFDSIRIGSNEKISWKPEAMEWTAENYTIDVQDSKIEASLKGVRLIRMIKPTIVEMSVEENKKQIYLMNETNKYGASNLTYDTNILILYTQYGHQDPQPSSSVEVVIDIVDDNARVVGFIKHEIATEVKEGDFIIRKKEESKWYNESRIALIKPEN